MSEAPFELNECDCSEAEAHNQIEAFAVETGTGEIGADIAAYDIIAGVCADIDRI